jgi:hypothetical protein
MVAAQGMALPQAVGQEQPATENSVAQPTDHGAAKPAAVGRPYYIEFRARNADSYGHTFSIYGRLGPNGGIATKSVAGLHPFTENPLPWMVGHLIMVPSETGASDGDTEDQYVLARFRVALTAEEYKKVTGYIKDLQKSSPVWHAVLYNCNAFVGDIAKFMGMETPGSTMLLPATYINSLRDLNIAKTRGIIGQPVRVESAERLREQALRALRRQPPKRAPNGTQNGHVDRPMDRHSTGPVSDKTKVSGLH